MSEALERTSGNLVWIDLEFTDLDPSRGAIMQAAMIVTRPDLTPIPPPGVPPEEGGLQFAISLSEDQISTASEWVQANQKEHIEECRGPNALPVERVEELFIAYLLVCSEIPDSIRSRPLLSGNSIHGDRNYLARYMPKLIELLSYRLLDVSGFKELASRWAPKLEFNKNPETIRRWYPADVEVKGAVHDALFDIKGSIAELNFYREQMFVPSARG
jgi:oligoribonuclease